jgi:hypothetical protein
MAAIISYEILNMSIYLSHSHRSFEFDLIDSIMINRSNIGLDKAQMRNFLALFSY